MVPSALALRTSPHRKRAWRRALRLLVLRGQCCHRGRRHDERDGTASLLADPGTLTSLRAALAPTRPPVSSCGVSVTTAKLLVRWTACLSSSVAGLVLAMRLFCP